MTDQAIAATVTPTPIEELARSLGIPGEAIEPYGRSKAKLIPALLPKPVKAKPARLILVSAISPTPAGEGKTTVTVGLGDALRRLGKNTVIALREPSLGPVFGVKGGAAGGGYAQVIPMEDLNLHFTGDFHAIAAANNLLAALVDNHIQQGNVLGLDTRRIVWRRCLDMNDRQLRTLTSGLGGIANGNPREDGFDITAASEVMAVLCLSEDIADLKMRLGRIVVGYTRSGKPVTAKDLNAAGAMAALLKDALKPNLAQTLEHSPVLIHGGPFANIAHGCNSVIATRTALQLGDYAVTEAGFGADLGAEKFLDIKCRMASLTPAACVVVATVRALKRHGGADLKALQTEDLTALAQGMGNLWRHVDNLREVYGLPAVVAINRFPTDTDAELTLLAEALEERGIPYALCEVWAKGGAGGEALARIVLELCEQPSDFRFSYDLDTSLSEKLNALVRRIYRGRQAVLTGEAQKQCARLERLGFGGLPVCVAKTQYSFSDDPNRLGAPEDFDVTVRSLRVSAGAGFIVALTGEVMTMPGLPKVPAAENIDVDEDGRITGIF